MLDLNMFANRQKGVNEKGKHEKILKGESKYT